ncbi:TetR/AcrR family transcriptional regulator [Curtobacterium sp. MCSS17_015]|uniref:TetR/AcrR family transcriptional regulator n=1 Tax=Curtobacterium sp. MCSS17_015 TaxID=2175666 RepID=UPI0011B5A9AF|nr:TetR/AcrR family transcriptional regulator [Curtobacterium sp. MCSS17_015]WIB25544.1 TetR/AcrR family transcriptional regulator [Curtobacterium sp. MCSS17_015]
MPRKPDPTLKPAIVCKVTEHLRDTRLEDVSVRSLGRVLGTSAYPIVYHFGSRDGLVDAVVEHLSHPVHRVRLDPDGDQHALAGYLSAVFGGLDDPDRFLAARLTFELGSVESLTGHDRHLRLHRSLIETLAAWCRAHGADDCTAVRASRAAVLACRGAQWGAVLDGDVAHTEVVLRGVARRLAAEIAGIRARTPHRSTALADAQDAGTPHGRACDDSAVRVGPVPVGRSLD